MQQADKFIKDFDCSAEDANCDAAQVLRFRIKSGTGCTVMP